MRAFAFTFEKGATLSEEAVRSDGFCVCTTSTMVSQILGGPFPLRGPSTQGPRRHTVSSPFELRAELLTFSIFDFFLEVRAV